VSDRPRPGQPRVTTDQQDHHIRLQHLRNRFKTAASTVRETPGRHNPCKWVLTHAKRCWRCRGVSSGPLNGRLERRPFSRSLRRTVAELIWGLCLPGVSLAVGSFYWVSKMPRLSNNDRNQALGMLRAGISTREVARLFNCHQSTVVRLRLRFQTTNTQTWHF
jgi:hypothetical protein